MTQMSIPKAFLVRRVLIPWTSSRVKQICKHYMYCQGLGRQTPEQIGKIGKDDVKALCDFLKDKSYMIGNFPSEVYCIPFAMMAILLFVHMDDHFKALVDDPNLVKHCIRMKDVFYPD